MSSIFTRHNSKSSNIITRFLISTCKYTWKLLVIAIILSHCNLKAYFYPFFLFLNLAAVSFRSCQAGILPMSDGVFLQQACDGLWAVGRYKQVDLSLFFDELRCGRLPQGCLGENISNNDSQEDKKKPTQSRIKGESHTSYCVDTFFKMSTCSFVVGVIERIWSLDKKKTDISKRHCPPWMMQTPLDQSGTNMSHCFRQRQRRRESFFGGGCGFVKIVSVLGISALVLVPQHSWYTGVCLLYCCHEIVFFLCGQQQITNNYNS